ncbi:MAG: hypothetical protein J0H98_07080 [Solirubrobacterales bacterium]|nr:hypothetical protein [Solirubrobacterales bacterium]
MNEIVPDAFADSYAEYLALVADPEMEITDHEGFLIALCVRRSIDQMRKSTLRRDRIELRPETSTNEDLDTRPDVSLEDALSRDHDLIEKWSPASQAVKRDQANVLFKTLREMPPGQRDAVKRVVLDGQKQVDAAAEIGIGIRPFEKRLKKGISQVAWALTQTSRGSMCGEYESLTATMKDPENPTRDQQNAVFKHVQSCSECQHSLHDSPFVIDLGALLATGAFTAHSGPTLSERLTSFPVIETPAEFVRNALDRVWPGSHGAEAAVGGGAAGGAGGTALALGGGKVLMALCAGAATTACVAGVATGVIPVTKSNADKASRNDAAAQTRTADVDPVEKYVDTRATYEMQRTAIENRIDRRAAKREARIQARKDAQAAATTSTPTSSSPTSDSGADQASYTSPVTTNPTTQAETNESSAAQSMGIPTAPAPTPAPTSSAQAKTNQSSADQSFGIGG